MHYCPFRLNHPVFILVCYFWVGLWAKGTAVVCCLRGFGPDGFAANGILMLSALALGEVLKTRLRLVRVFCHLICCREMDVCHCLC